MILGKKIYSSIGLDISDLNVRFVQLYRKGNVIKIQSIGHRNLPEGAIKEGVIIDEKAVADTVIEMLAKPDFGAITPSNLTACLPETKTFIKLLEIEDHPNQLEDIIPGEIEKHIPFSSDNLYYDWQKIKNKNNENFILCAAVEKNIANQYIEMLKKTKLSISALEIESIAICRSILLEESSKYPGIGNKNYALIDIGANRSSMIIYSKNTIITNISMPISGNQITKKIAKTLDIEDQKAEEAKIICGLDKEKAKGIVSEILSEMSKKLIQKIKTSLDFYYEHHPQYGDIDEIILCGGGANIKKLDQLIEKETDIKTKILSPFTNIHEKKETFDQYISQNKKNKQTIKIAGQNSSLSFTTAIGLALRDIV